MMLRKLSIGVFAVVALVIAGAVALLVFFDVNRFKPQIEQATQERLQRRLAIEGDLALSVLPRLAVSLPRTTLYERDGKAPLLTLERARVGVELLPLLAGRVEVDRIRVEGLSARIRRAADGSTNIDDLLQPGKAPTEAKKAESRPLEFDIGGVELVDAELRLIEPTGTTTLSGLSLKTGRFAPGARLPIDAATRFTLPSKASGEAKLSASVTFDPAAPAYGAERINAEVRTGDVEARLTAPKLQASGDTVRGEGVALTLKRGGDSPADVTLKVAAFEGPAKALAIERVDLAADVRQGARRIAATLASPAQASIDNRTLALPKLAGNVTIDDPALPMKSLKLPVAGALTVDARRQSVDLRAETRFDDTTLAARIDVDDFARPRIGFDVNADRFDLDRYAGPPTNEKGARTGSAPARIDFSALRGLNAAGQIAVGELQARGLKASAVRIGVKAANGRADVAPIAARLYGGTLNGSARAAADGNRVSVDATLADVAVGPLLKDVLQKQPLEGRGNVRLAAATGGATAEAMKRGLDGSASLRIRDGAVRGIDIVRKLRDARALIGGKADSQQASAAEKTDFSELSVSFAIRNGVATSDDLDLRSPLLRAGGAGRIDLAAGTIDYTVRVAPTGVAELRGVVVPVRLSGPFEQLAYTIDWSGLAREAVRSKLVDEQKKKLEERALDALKGLLRR